MRRLAAVWFADIVGFTELSSRDEDAAMKLVDLFQIVTRRAVGERGGTVVKFLGDGGLAVFPSSDAATRAGLAVQREFVERASAAGSPAALRIGIHVGEVIEAPDGDVYGDGVNIGARIQCEAEPGQVVVSGDVRRQLRQRPGYRLQVVGERSLRGVEEPVEIWVVVEGPAEEQLVDPGAGSGARRTLNPLYLAAGVAAAILLVLVVMALWRFVESEDAATAGAENTGVEAIGTAVPETPVERASIAVLPFVNMSGDPEQEYFSDGLTEELLNALAQVPGLRVAARTSSFAFKGQNVPVDEIGERLRVANVLEGSVRRSGDQLRITAQLIDTENGYHRWSETYDRELADVFVIQEEIARAIVDTLRLTLAGAGEQAVQPGTSDLEAYNLYLQGRFYANRFTESELRRALELYRRALEKDPQYAEAYAAIAEAWTWLADDWVAPREAYPMAREAAVRSLELDPDLAAGHLELGHVRMWYEWDFAGAERELRRALEINPNHADTHSYLAILLALGDRPEEAAAVAERAVTLDPVSWHVLGRAAWANLVMHRYEDAIRLGRRAFDINPASAHFNLRMLGDALLAEERAEEALATYRRGLTTAPDYVRLRNGEARALAELGRGDEARRIALALEEEAEQRYVRGEEIAGIWAALGDRDRAFRWLDRAYEERSAGMPFLAYPMYDPLRSDPRFQALVRKVGLQ